MMKQIIGYAAQSANESLEPFSFQLRKLRDNDIQIEVLYCGVCHSDIGMVQNEWLTSQYPMVPGHEVVGRIVYVGSSVTTFKVGDIVAPLAIIDSCGTCDACKNHLEQYCQNGYVFMYNTIDKYMKSANHGGFSKQVIVHEKFVVHIPDFFKTNLAATASLMCAGLTTYSAFKYWKIGKGHKVGVVGIGGLGHLAVKIARALDAKVIAITTTEDKKNDTYRLGAEEAILSTDFDTMKKYAHSFDFIINTIPASHDLAIYLDLLKLNGTMCLVGRPQKPHAPLSAESLNRGRKSLTGSVYGGIEEMIELLNFCAKHSILADIELIPIQQINQAFENVIDKKVRYRYVVDMTSL